MEGKGDNLAKRFTESGAKLACLCSSDYIYGREAADAAKAKGQNKISMRAPIGEHAEGVKDLNEALRYYHMILAVPIEKQSRPFEDAGIRTWYKFKIVEKLSHKQLKPCDCVPADLVAPQEMFPLGADEILIPRGGGSVMVDGIDHPIADPFDLPERDFRIGIHLGDVVEESDGDLMGGGVNIAARLEGIAAPGAICSPVRVW